MLIPSHTTWIFLTSDTRAPLADTLALILNDQLLWRSVYNRNGALIANVGNLQVGDHIIAAWREKHGITAYLLARIASPLSPVGNTPIDTITGDAATRLVSAGYPQEPDGTVHAIRVDRIEECYFHVRGRYGGNNTIHRLASTDIQELAEATAIPHDRLLKPSASDATRPAPPATTCGPLHAGSTVDRFSIAAASAARSFDAYIMVDWSSSSRPVTGNDSIWIASGCWSSSGFTAGIPENVATRKEAKGRIEALAGSWMRAGMRVLVGLDFAFGYPAGFSRALGLPATKPPWRTIHQHFSEHVTDDHRNLHNRDHFAAACNERIEPTGLPGPFWGCQTRAIGASLTQQRVGVFAFPYAGMDEWRLTERHAARRTATQSVWKINCGVSVGGQTILGIKYLHEMAEALNARRWPFDTGWTIPTSPCIWFAEIFPSLIYYPEWEEEYSIHRDRTQVQSCVRFSADKDSRGELAKALSEPPGVSERDLRRIESEEGWILFA